MALRKKGSNGSQSVENALRKGPWTCHKADNGNDDMHTRTCSAPRPAAYEEPRVRTVQRVANIFPISYSRVLRSLTNGTVKLKQTSETSYSHVCSKIWLLQNACSILKLPHYTPPPKNSLRLCKQISLLLLTNAPTISRFCKSFLFGARIQGTVRLCLWV